MEFFLFIGACCSIANLIVLVILLKKLEHKSAYMTGKLNEFYKLAKNTERKLEPLLSSFGVK